MNGLTESRAGGRRLVLESTDDTRFVTAADSMAALEEIAVARKVAAGEYHTMTLDELRLVSHARIRGQLGELDAARPRSPFNRRLLVRRRLTFVCGA